ncbi:hypothetical protein BDR07DRAFT_965643 [Suillus spraguei]|nr:hypothetical protein BDR07DRAFT_965643 [Suillus spraguei]
MILHIPNEQCGPPTLRIDCYTCRHSLRVLLSVLLFPPVFSSSSTSLKEWQWKYHGNIGVLQILVFSWTRDIYGMAIHGSRVFVPDETPYNNPMEYRLQLMDYSPLAMKHHQGLGRVVREPSTVDLEGELITTSLPYVEAVLTKSYCNLRGYLWLSSDEDKIYILHSKTESAGSSLY